MSLMPDPTFYPSPRMAMQAPPERLAYVAEVREALRPQLTNSEGKWTADYVRLRFVDIKET